MGQPPEPANRRRRAGRWSIVALATAVILCAAGGSFAFFAVQTVAEKGSATPDVALDGFLRGVFIQQMPTTAAGFVCPDGRDNPDLIQLVYVARSAATDAGYHASWSYPPIPTGQPGARVQVDLVLASTGERIIGERTLKVKLINDNGWWVCGVDDRQ